MTKEAERNYPVLIGEAGRSHAKHKPFSNDDCGLTLCSIGAIMNLMPPRPARILDLGCGTGWTSIFLAKHGYEVVGQDISPAMIEIAEQSRIDSGIGDNLSFRVGDFERRADDGGFDCVLFFDCLHHADDEAEAIRFAANSLKPQGIMITHEPGEGHSTAQHSIDAMRLYGVNEKDMPPHLIIRHARAAGFVDFRIFPMQHDILARFYGTTPPRFLSREGLRRAAAILRFAFQPSDRAGAILLARRG